MPYLPIPCRHCGRATSSGLLVCRDCWSSVPMTLRASFKAARNPADTAAAAREILRHLGGHPVKKP
jgi:hypothetical protein